MTQHTLAALLIRRAAHHAPAALAERLQEEWLADLRARQTPLSRLTLGFGCVWAAMAISHEGHAAPVPVPLAAMPVPLALPAGGNLGQGSGRRLFARDDDMAEVPALCDINTTPLIDVMLVLLITLILSLPILTHAVKIELPTTPTTRTQPPPEVIDLDIDFDGAVAWNGTPVATARQLEGYFRTEARKEPQPEIRMRPNAHVKYDVVAKVLASAQRNGMRKLGFVDTVRFAQ